MQNPSVLPREVFEIRKTDVMICDPWFPNGLPKVAGLMTPVRRGDAKKKKKEKGEKRIEASVTMQ